MVRLFWSPKLIERSIPSWRLGYGWVHRCTVEDHVGVLVACYILICSGGVTLGIIALVYTWTLVKQDYERWPFVRLCCYYYMEAYDVNICTHLFIPSFEYLSSHRSLFYYRNSK
jgi:hypothetical protein